MKNVLKICMMLMLLVTIVLPVSSQVVFMIDGERYTCYNDNENREIAKIIIEGEYCDSINLVINNEIELYKARNNELENLYIEAKGINNSLSLQLDDCLLVANEYKSSYVEVSNTLNKRINILYGSLGLNLILTLILIL